MKDKKIKELSRFSYLSLAKALEFYFVFEGLVFSEHYSDVKTAIKAEILENLALIESKFSTLSKESYILCLKLAKGARKLNKMRDLRFKSAVFELKKLGIINIEKSLETKPLALFGQKLKREIRRHKIADKIHFSKNFYRFYFAFIAPNIDKINSFSEQEKEQFIANLDLEPFYSLPFELICADFLASKLGIERSMVSSYWDKDCEIDIFIKNEHFMLAGEVKYKDHIVSKKLLNELKAKCEIAGLKPDFFVLFSKNGFSKELEELSKKTPNIWLFSLENFKEIL